MIFMNSDFHGFPPFLTIQIIQRQRGTPTTTRKRPHLFDLQLLRLHGAPQQGKDPAEEQPRDPGALRTEHRAEGCFWEDHGRPSKNIGFSMIVWETTQNHGKSYENLMNGLTMLNGNGKCNPSEILAA
jgi:hypothetical protein